LLHCNFEEQLGDIFTKAFSSAKFMELRSKMKVFLKSFKEGLIILLKLCLQVWRGEEWKTLRGEKYEEKWRNLSNFLKE
jgi:hypothetical protein